MHRRNKYMVDNSQIVLAVWAGTFGGTANTLKYAQALNKEIVFINPTNM